MDVLQIGMLLDTRWTASRFPAKNACCMDGGVEVCPGAGSGFPFLWRKVGTICLAAACLAGGIAGLFVFARSGTSSLSVMRQGVSAPVSIVSAFGCALLPFLFAALAVSCSAPWLLPVLGFSVFFRFCLVSCLVCAAWGDAGWLLRWLLLWPRGLTLPLFYWYLHRHVRGEGISGGLPAVLAVGLLLLSLGYRIILPLLRVSL